MSLYICRRCASTSLRRTRVSDSITSPPSPSRTSLSSTSKPSTRSSWLFNLVSSRSFGSCAPKRSLPAQAITAATPSPSIAARNISHDKPSAASSYALSGLPELKPANEQSHHQTTIERLPHPVSHARGRIKRLARQLDVDAMYLVFWELCSKQSIEHQKLIWSSSPHDQDHSQQESIYRLFNTSATPAHVSFLSGRKAKDRISPTISITYQRTLQDGREEPSTFNLQFITQSHSKRLLQMHQYFQQVLGLPIGYFSRIALVVAFASRGDMITAMNIFREWQQDRPGTGGKDMYSAIIRGLVGNNYQTNTSERPHRISKDWKTGIRNHGVTQMHAALELFYELLRQGGTPTFETYHSLIQGLATFKNDMEAAELLLDHMIMTKKKPYVQVLHIMCREYARRKDFVATERIFGLLKEYGIKPRALTCNIMLRAIFQMSTLEALQYLGPHYHHQAEHPTEVQEEDLEEMAQQLKRQKIQQLREYMDENGTVPDETTFSTLVYGYGHMKDGYRDLEATVKEMSQLQPPTEPNLVILNSLLFGNLNHGQVKRAEAILDRMLATEHPIDRSVHLQQQPRMQVSSPFQKRSGPKTRAKQELVVTQGEENEVTETRRPFMVPGKGTFHALMLAHVERADILGMERILDKMIQAHQQQSASSRQTVQSRSRSLSPPDIVDLEADEYTANIMLLGYLGARDFSKVDLIQKQIRSRKDWRSSTLFWDREEDRCELVEFVKQQSSKEVVRRSLLESADQEDVDHRMDDGPKGSSSDTTSSSTSRTVIDPLSDNLQGELDDDIEIDVTTLSAKLRCLMSRTSSSMSSS
ncbi:hypothetical protein BGX28_002800 [Mortierella sp. GBA30]|nr:hypothetical protein BGX28_002800 [Mortierella sp. GBA30]